MDFLVWRKSSWSYNQNCVEVAVRPRTVSVRDSKDREGWLLTISGTKWRAFMDAVKSGAVEERRSDY